MKVLMSGATGLVGKTLVPHLEQSGHTVGALIRQTTPSVSLTVKWDPLGGQVSLPALEGFDAVIHLAGENIASGRWTEAKKKAIRESRVKSSQFLTDSILKLEKPPHTVLSASAIGYYGDRPGKELYETSEPGTGFLPEVCQDWENAFEPLRKKGIRVVNLRLGVILAREGGALPKMVPPFKLGLGGRIGPGTQYMSWVSLEDVVGAILFLLNENRISGPVNIVSPNPVTNYEFTKVLGSVLNRPTFFPLPSFMARIIMGEMADDLLLASQKINPAVLKTSGYSFKHADLEAALRYFLA